MGYITLRSNVNLQGHYSLIGHKVLQLIEFFAVSNELHRGSFQLVIAFAFASTFKVFFILSNIFYHLKNQNIYFNNSKN